MFNNRMLAVAAVLAMAVPALGAATPIVVPPVPEQLVEGHTVFTVIEIVAVTQTNETRFAAAVAVLVREYDAEVRNQRFPGVLWFNDQYLVNPSSAANNNAAFRYPCGGAVMAVNAGDPDPRVVIARVGDGGNTYGADGDLTVGDSEQTYTYPPWNKPYPGTYSYGNDYAWVGVDPADQEVYSDTVVGSTPAAGVAGTAMNVLGVPVNQPNGPFDYRESYLITDPNDHSWVIDVYDFYTRYGVDADEAGTVNPGVGTTRPLGPTATPATVIGGDQVYGPAVIPPTYPVWVVNILGTPVFLPDFGTGLENCAPFKDLVQDVLGSTGVDAAGCGVASLPPWTDNPCMSYQEPSRNGYCYGGQSAADGCFHGSAGNCEDNRHLSSGDDPAAGCGYAGDPPYVNTPLRQYNALLYFKLEDLRIAGAPRDHSDPVGGDDTNGCSEEQYPWGPNPPQAAYDWPCPGDDDNAEGNSHPFHPTLPPHVEQQPCPPAFYGPNPTNHGGSSYITPGTPNYDGWYQVYAPCDYLHATRNIDIYFSPAGRPFPPVLRSFDVLDYTGSTAPFHDFHSAYPGTP